MKLFLTSISECLSSIESFKNLINEHTRLVILPISYDKRYINCAEDVYNHFDRCVHNPKSIYWKIARPFIDSGILSENICVINPYTDPMKYVKHRLTAPNTIVYLPGGFPENIVKNIKKFRLSSIIKQVPILVGESAGSMAPFSSFFVYKDQDYKRYKSYLGLSLIRKRMTFIPHYDISNKNIQKACLRYSKTHLFHDIYLVEDGGYILFDTESNKILEMNKAHKFK